MSKTAIRINEADAVAVALQPLTKGNKVTLEAQGSASEVTVTLQEDITAGHKFAIREIKKGEPVIKYGYPIGSATCDIPQGSHVHIQNTKTLLSEDASYTYDEEGAKALLAGRRLYENRKIDQALWVYGHLFKEKKHLKSNTEK